MNEVGIKEIAGRVRALVSGRYGERMSDAAVGLGIDEPELSALLQGRLPAVRSDRLVAVLTRVVRHFGVDPSWLVTGRYDVRTHLTAEEHRADLIGLRFQMHQLLSGPDRPIAMDPVKRADEMLPADAPVVDWTEGVTSYNPEMQRDNGRRGQDGEPDR